MRFLLFMIMKGNNTAFVPLLSWQHTMGGGGGGVSICWSHVALAKAHMQGNLSHLIYCKRKSSSKILFII